jgi:hypothetical protein
MLLSPTSLMIAGALLLLIAIGAAVVAWRRESGLVAMDSTPTLSVAELSERHHHAASGRAAMGQPVEVVGTIECDAPLAAPYSETICVAYRYTVSEANEQRVIRPNGHSARTHAFAGQDDQYRHVARFYVRDASGRIPIDPDGAAIEMIETLARYEAYSGLAGSERQVWREERALPLGYRVYVLGYLLSDQGEPLLGRHPVERGRRFLISHRDEASLIARVRTQAYALYAGAILAAAGAVAAWIAAARM